MKKKTPKNGPNLIQKLVQEKVTKVKEKVDKKELEKITDRLANLELLKEVLDSKVHIWNRQSDFKKTYKIPSFELKSDNVLCLVMSDIHIGKKTHDYDYQIFKSHLETLLRQTSEIVLTKNIREIVIFLIGDVCDGQDIYPGHSNFISMSVAEQSVEGAKDLSDFVLTLSQYCPVKVKCIAGNHGRDGKKGENTLKQNWDTVLYHIMKVHLKNASNVDIEISEDWKMFVKIGSMTFMAFHGDDVAAGSPLTSLPKAVVNWADSWRQMQPFDAALCGHYHLPVLGIDVNGRELFVNGSFSPPEDYTEKKIKARSKQGQISFIVKNGSEIIDRNLLKF